MALTDLLPTTYEDESDRDGFLSVYREWHSLTVGLAIGLVAGLTGTWELAGIVAGIALGVRAAKGPLEDVRQEPWYALGGLTVTLVLATVARVLFL